MPINQAKTPFTRLETPHGTLYLKREDLSESGSHKWRYLQAQLQQLHAEGHNTVVLSTTGNVGISASKYGSEFGMKVICFMSEKGDMSKASQIEREGGVLCLSDRPVRWAKYLHKKHGIPLLKGSESDLAVDGYESLGREIIDEVPEADAIVNFCTSGTSTLGIAQAYERSGRDLPAIHLVQSGRSCSVVRALNPEQVDEDEVEQSVGLESTPRKDDLWNLIEESDGDAWYVKRSELEDSRKLLEAAQIEVSWECQATVSVALELLKSCPAVVVILSGKQWPDAQHLDAKAIKSPSDADDLI